MKWDNSEISKVKDLILQGKNYIEIAELMGKSRDSIRYVANYYGFKFKEYNPDPSSNCSKNEKYCGTCKTIKNSIVFNKNKRNKDGLNSICKECSQKRSRQYYNENREEHKKVIKKRRDVMVLNNRKNLLEYYKNNPCVDCGNSNPIVLELDHKDGKDKFMDISKMIQSYNWKIIFKEIQKCDVRCANCHRIKTAKQFNWYKGLL